MADIVLTIENCTFRNNTAREGGALWFSNSVNVTISNSNFESNSAVKGTYLGGYGGAIFCEDYCKVWISNSNFIGNKADHRGGAIYSDYGTHLDISNSNFDSNSISSAGHGGAMFVEDRNSQSDGTYVYLSNCVFTNNIATQYGGAVIWFNGVTPNIKSTVFDSNIAAIGGAIANYDDTVYTGFESNTFSNNIALSNDSFNDIYNASLPETPQLQELVDSMKNDVNITHYLNQLWQKRAYTLEYNYYIQQSDYICYVNEANECDSGMFFFLGFVFFFAFFVLVLLTPLFCARILS